MSGALEEFHKEDILRDSFGKWKQNQSQSTQRRINDTGLICGNAHHIF